jgi:hypothetical protein
LLIFVIGGPSKEVPPGSVQCTSLCVVSPYDYWLVPGRSQACSEM